MEVGWAMYGNMAGAKKKPSGKKTCLLSEGKLIITAYS